MKHRSRAQATVFLVVMLPLFLAVGGIALDAGHLFVQRTRLQAIADAAARAGAIQIDEAGLYSRADGVVRLDPTAAREAAMYYAMYNGALAEDVQTDQASVYVRMTQDVPTVFLRVVRITSLQIHAEATARPRFGVSRVDG
jgi:Putative Flp pilus-assembly TadE/G-like